MLLLANGGHPVDDLLELECYCQRERQKIIRFRKDHETFLRYYEEARTDHDALFFLRRNYEAEPRPYIRVYDEDPEFITAFYWIVALQIGNALFDQFLQEQLNKLGADDEALYFPL